MPIVLQVFVVASCLVLLVGVVSLVRSEKLQLRYALLWLVLAITTMICSLFPELLFEVSKAFGFAAPSNFIFLLGFFFLLIITLSLSVIASEQAVCIKDLVQKIALLDYEVYGQLDDSIKESDITRN